MPACPDARCKIEPARKRIDASGRDIRMQGGIKAGNIARVATAGADTFVAGSAICNAKDYAGAIAEMRSRLTA
jgi:ribulose-phosphate 3-epimerase